VVDAEQTGTLLRPARLPNGKPAWLVQMDDRQALWRGRTRVGDRALIKIAERLQVPLRLLIKPRGEPSLREHPGRIPSCQQTGSGAVMRAGSTLLRTGVATLAVSLVAALLLANPQDVFGDHRTLLMLTSWVERTLFWVGLIFIAGAVLDQVYGPRRD
jgi:hypothetical protein